MWPRGALHDEAPTFTCGGLYGVCWSGCGISDATGERKSMCAAPIRGGAATYLSALEQHVAPRGHVGCQVRVKPLLAFLQRAAIDRVSDLPGRTTVEE